MLANTGPTVLSPRSVVNLPSPRSRPHAPVPSLPSPCSCLPKTPSLKINHFNHTIKKLLPSPHLHPPFLELHIPSQYYIHAGGDVVVEEEILIMWKCCEVYFGVTCKKLERIKMQETDSYGQDKTSTNMLLLTKI